MNIAVDIDDTLTDSFDYFLPFVAEYFGAEEEELRQKIFHTATCRRNGSGGKPTSGKRILTGWWQIRRSSRTPHGASENCGHSGIGSSSLPVARPIFTLTRTGRPRRNCGVAELFTTS